MKVNKGDIFYKAWLNIESCQTEKSTIEIEEWVVTNFNKNGIYLTQKINRITWGKKSTKNGDFGFLENIDSIFKEHISPGEIPLSKLFFKTKVGAFRSSKPIIEKKYKEIKKLLVKVNKEISNCK